MAVKEVLINVGPGETRVALLEDGRLSELHYERAPTDDDAGLAERRSCESRLGDIMLGRVQRVLPGVQAAFVDIGLPRAGFLSARDARRRNPCNPTPCAGEAGADEARCETPPINTLVHEGETLLVQIIKDPIGDKGARLTTSVTLPGRLLVLVPQTPVVAMSRRITDCAARERLTALVSDLNQKALECHGIEGGFIVRSAAVEATCEELAEDAERLWAKWRAIEEMQGEARPPMTLHRDAGPIARTLRDHVDRDTTRILIDETAAFNAAVCIAREILPQLADRIGFFNGPQPLFEAYGIEAEIDTLLSARVPLASGGWITVETTEALTAIDVNSGRLSAGCLEDTGFQTNLAAAVEIGRQLRLREIGGLIVVDFIHMESPDNIRAVEAALEQALTCDRTPVAIGPMSPFGLVEITRKRVREPLGRFLTAACGACSGRGRVKSAGTVANEAFRKLLAQARYECAPAWKIRVASDVAGWMFARRQSALAPLKARLGADVCVEPVAQFDRERIEICAAKVIA